MPMMREKAKRAIGDYDYNESAPKKRDEYVSVEKDSDKKKEDSDPSSDKAGKIAMAIARGMAAYGKKMEEYDKKQQGWRRRFSK